MMRRMRDGNKGNRFRYGNRFRRGHAQNKGLSFRRGLSFRSGLCFRQGTFSAFRGGGARPRVVFPPRIEFPRRVVFPFRGAVSVGLSFRFGSGLSSRSRLDPAAGRPEHGNLRLKFPKFFISRDRLRDKATDGVTCRAPGFCPFFPGLNF